MIETDMKSLDTEVIPSIKHRFSGILVHPTSFPSPYGIGDLGAGSYEFIDFLEDSGQSLWQVLPLGHTGYGDSPYQAFSSFAGQPLMISPDELLKMGLLLPEDVAHIPNWDPQMVDYGPAIVYKTGLLQKAYNHFKVSSDVVIQEEYEDFCEKNSWILDYSLFMASKDYHNGDSWLSWEDELRDPDEITKTKWHGIFHDEMGYYKFIQYLFFKQWYALKHYANEKHISIIGDIPIFVSPDSADVWANKELFQLDAQGFPTHVAGVPPDYFSETGQLWGNPLYKWEVHKASGYAWWIERIQAQLKMTDYLRIDHFRGFESYWAVPFGQKTAMEGEWLKGPGADFFQAVEQALGDGLPIIAEDLGIITKEVEELRDVFHFPGMKILQFAFENIEDNDFLPHNYTRNCICYTGTHDNDTTIGWYDQACDLSQDKMRRYLNTDASNPAWDFIRACLGSVADMAVFPLQDVFSLDSTARMNTPGVAAGNWGWRYSTELLTDELRESLLSITKLYGRL